MFNYKVNYWHQLYFHYSLCMWPYGEINKFIINFLDMVIKRDGRRDGETPSVRVCGLPMPTSNKGDPRQRVE